MTDEKNEFLLQVVGIHIPALYFIKPGKIFFFPITIATFQRASRATARNKDIITHVGKLVEHTYIKLIRVDVNVIFLGEVTQNTSQASHALVGFTFIKI